MDVIRCIPRIERRGQLAKPFVPLDNPLTSGQLTAAEVGDDVAVVSADHFLAVSLGQKVIDTPSIRLCVA